MNNVKNIGLTALVLFACAALFAPAAFPQTAMTSTTLAAAVDQSQKTVKLSSITGVSEPSNLIAQGPGNPTGSGTMLLVVDQEAMRVQQISGTVVTVSRGYAGTKRSTHASGAKVWFGTSSYFASTEPTGSCTLTNLTVHPAVLPSGEVFYCVDSLWKKGNADYIGTAATGVIAAEQGSGRYHVTTLTFTGKTLGSAAGNAALAFGASLYTFPAGAYVVKSAYMSVGLTDTGAVVDANTPDTGLGTVVGSGANAALSASPAGSESILTGQTVTNVTGTALTKTVSDQITPIESGGSHTLYLNTAALWAGADTVKATGMVVIEWVLLK